MMGLKKLLDKLSDILDPVEKDRRKNRKKLKAIVKELRSREKTLKAKLESTDDEHKRNRLQKELNIIHGQRMKGIAAMRSGDKSGARDSDSDSK